MTTNLSGLAPLLRRSRAVPTWPWRRLQQPGHRQPPAPAPAVQQPLLQVHTLPSLWSYA